MAGLAGIPSRSALGMYTRSALGVRSVAAAGGGEVCMLTLETLPGPPSVRVRTRIYALDPTTYAILYSGLGPVLDGGLGGLAGRLNNIALGGERALLLLHDGGQHLIYKLDPD